MNSTEHEICLAISVLLSESYQYRIKFQLELHHESWASLCGVLCIWFTFGKLFQECFMNNNCWINCILQSVTATIKFSLLVASRTKPTSYLFSIYPLTATPCAYGDTAATMIQCLSVATWKRITFQSSCRRVDFCPKMTFGKTKP